MNNGLVVPSRSALNLMLHASVSVIAVVHAPMASAQTEEVMNQATPTRAGVREIIVTARKREESIMRTPVIIDAISAQEIEDLKITDFSDLAQITPGLQLSPAFGTVGTTVYLRGLGNGTSANFGDQSVQLNSDGISTTHGSFYKTALFDVGQVEVLKGPQALFFGRSASGGIVATTSALPTADWESRVTAGYEFDSDEMSLNGYISGPISENFGIRLAGFYSVQEGWLRNDNPVGGGRVPDETGKGGRVTLTYDDHSRLKATLRYMKARTSSNMWVGDVGQGVCRGPTRQSVGYVYDDCRANRNTQSSPIGLPYDPAVDWYDVSTFLDPTPFGTSQNDPLFRDGLPYAYTETDQATLNVDYEVADGLTVSSVTGWTKLDTVDVGQAFFPGLPVQFGLAGQYKQDQISQELRLTSDWGGWIDFLVGGFYSDGEAKNHTGVNFPAFSVAQATDGAVKTRIYSAFGQILISPTDKLELAAGLRYSNVRKRISRLNYLNNTSAFSSGTPAEFFYGDVLANADDGLVPDVNGDPFDPSKTENNTSPEFTITYTPTDDITIFGSYKHGYKAHGANINFFTGSYVPGQVEFYDGEKVKGWEGGVKASLLDRRLNLTAAAYTYAYDNLQVAFASGGDYTVVVRNGADARVKGVELGAVFQPIENLTLNADLNYNDAKYTSFTNAPCYSGQQFESDPELANRCVDANPDPNVFFGIQDLTGERLARAPKWTGQFGANFVADVEDDLQVGFSFNSNYSSGYLAIDQLNPISYQKSYWTFDTGLRVGDFEGPWEVGLTVRNITNKTIFSGGINDDISFAPMPSDILIYRYRPRQIHLSVTFRPHHF